MVRGMVCEAALIAFSITAIVAKARRASHHGGFCAESRNNEQDQLAPRAWVRAIGRDRLDHPRLFGYGMARPGFAALLNNHLGKPTPGFMALNVVIDLLGGLSLLWLYAAIRPRYSAGAKTAVIAVFAWWFIVTLGDATWCSFGFFPPRTVIR
jgi:hypothetical protein